METFGRTRAVKLMVEICPTVDAHDKNAIDHGIEPAERG
jgi:hypothetical protein